MSLYLANPSTQNVIFGFREPKNNLVQYIDIMAGSQTAIGHDWTKEQQARVIEQIERFGGRDAAETHRPMGRFMGLIYRDTGIIESDEIDMARAAETQTREERSATEATKAALGFDRAVRKGQGRRPGARQTTVEVEQEIAPGERPRGNEVTFGLTVDPEGRNDVKLPV